MLGGADHLRGARDLTAMSGDLRARGTDDLKRLLAQARTHGDLWGARQRGWDAVMVALSNATSAERDTGRSTQISAGNGALGSPSNPSVAAICATVRPPPRRR